METRRSHLTGPPTPAATLQSMAKQSKKPADLNRLAASIVGDATGQSDAKAKSTRKTPKKAKKKD